MKTLVLLTAGFFAGRAYQSAKETARVLNSGPVKMFDFGSYKGMLKDRLAEVIVDVLQDERDKRKQSSVSMNNWFKDTSQNH